MNETQRRQPAGTHDEESLWTRRFWLLCAAVFALRVVWVALVPGDLGPDESYYWDWGRRLSFGYFSKPPFIAWLMAWAGWTGGDTQFGVRLWAAVFGTAAMAMLFLLGQRMYGAKAGFLAGALFAAMPGAALFSMLMTVDSPLMFFWCAALWAFHGVLHGEGRARTGYALALWLALGFGSLTKQILWTFPLLALIYLLLDGPQGRAKLKSPLVLAPLLGGFLFLLPTVIWNMHNGWITYVHTKHHFEPATLADFPKHFGDFIGMQLGAISPVTVCLLYALVFSGLIGWRRLSSRERMLVAFSAIPLAVMFCMTLRQRLNGNWGAAFYPAGLVMVAAWASAAGGLQGIRLPEKTRRWVRPGLWVGVALSALVYLAPLVVHLAGLEGAKADPLARLRGWSDFARRVDEVRATLPQKDMPILVVGRRFHVSTLAFYLHDQPRVFQWVTPGIVESQYQVWGGLDELKGREVLVVYNAKPGWVLPAEAQAALSSLTPLESLRIEVGHGRGLDYQLYRAIFTGDPQTAGAAKTIKGDSD